MRDTVLGTTITEKDVGATIRVDVNVSEQCSIAASRSNQILGLISKYISYIEKELTVYLHKAMIRPYL